MHPYNLRPVLGRIAPHELNVKEHRKAEFNNHRVPCGVLLERPSRASISRVLSKDTCAKVEARVQHQETGKRTFRCPEESVGPPKQACNMAKSAALL